MIELDGSIRFAWTADGFATIRVVARRRDTAELTAFARTVADAALLERTVAGLRTRLQASHPGGFELHAQRRPHDAPEPYLTVSLNPPRGEPNPDPLV
jgi:hypothetical protein